jgi:hypothetical protein
MPIKSRTFKKFAPQLKIADMSSMVGVALVGLGLGGALNEHLVGVIPALIASGVVLHALGMFGKFEIEREHIDPPGWVLVAFGICSIVLMLSGLYILISRYVVTAI